MFRRNRSIDRMTVSQAVIFDGMVFTTGVTGIILLGNSYMNWGIDSSMLPYGNKLSNTVPTALWALAVLTFAVAASFARPRGLKWALRDLFWSLYLLACLVLAILIRKANPTADVLSTWVIIGGVIVLDLSINQIWSGIRHYWVADTVAPTGRFTSSPMGIPVGGNVTLSWSSVNAVSAEINGVGIVPVNGTTVVTPAGAAGATVTYTLTLKSADGTVETFDTTVTLT